MKTIAILLIAAGLLGLTAGTISFTTKEKVVDIGPIDVTRDKQHSQRIPFVGSIAALVVGSILLFAGARPQHR